MRGVSALRWVAPPIAHCQIGGYSWWETISAPGCYRAYDALLSTEVYRSAMTCILGNVSEVIVARVVVHLERTGCDAQRFEVCNIAFTLYPNTAMDYRCRSCSIAAQMLTSWSSVLQPSPKVTHAPPTVPLCIGIPMKGLR